MFTSAFRFLASIAATFALLSYMWCTAASAADLGDRSAVGCRNLANGVTMCDGAGYQLPEAPRGTVKHRTAVSVAHRATVLYSRLNSERRGTTVIIARLGR